MSVQLLMLTKPLFFPLISDDITILLSTSIELSSSKTEQCFDVILENDTLVEGTETVTLSLELTESGSGIRDIAPNTTDIIITDDDCELLIIIIIMTFVF